MSVSESFTRKYSLDAWSICEKIASKAEFLTKKLSKCSQKILLKIGPEQKAFILSVMPEKMNL